MRRLRIAMTSALLAAANLPAAAQCDYWELMNPNEPSLFPYAFAVYNGELLVGGDSSFVWRWTGRAWEALGDSIPGADEIHTFGIFNGELFAGGFINAPNDQSAYGLVRWDGVAWQFFPVPVPTYASVGAMTVYNNELIVGGRWDSFAELDSPGLVRWNGSTWLPFPGFGSNDNIRALSVHDGDLVAAGRFSTAGGQPANRIARFNGIGWEPLGEGITGLALPSVHAMANHNGSLVVGGTFEFAGGKQTNSIARWDGSEWHPLGSGFTYGDRVEAATVRDLVVLNGEIVAGGSFIYGDGNVTQFIARWDGSTWRELSGGLDDYVFAVTAFEGDLIAGMDFEVWRWHDLPGECLGSCCYQSECYMTTFEACDAAGGIYYGSGVPCDQVVCEDQCETWQPMGGLSYDSDFGWLAGLELYDDTIIAFGEFALQLPGHVVVSVAAWDGQSWQPVDGALGAPGFYPFTTLTHNGVVYVAGTQVARFDGAAWQVLGEAFTDGWISRLAVFEGDVIAAGTFKGNGSQPLNQIARWDGQSWQPLAQGITGTSDPWIRSMTVYGDRLIVAGRFEQADGKSSMNIASWDGRSWHALGQGLTGDNYAHAADLTVFDGMLIAGGSFTHAGGAPAPGLAAWNGTTWSNPFASVSGPTPYEVSALAVFQNQLVASADWIGGSGSVGTWDEVASQWTLSFPFNGLPAEFLATEDALVAAGYFYSVREYDGPPTRNIAQFSLCPKICAADLNVDDAVNVRDLVMVLHAWGQCPQPLPPACFGDITRDGRVHIGDVFAVIANWGPCP